MENDRSRDDEIIRRFAGRTKQEGNGADKAPQTHEWPPSLDLEVLAEREPEAPRFIMADWLPEGYATLFAGHGGVGKSAIALHLAVCMAAGIPFFGIPVERRRVLYLSCEDREKVLHWRLARICKHLGLDMAGLRGWLEIIDLVGSDTILWSRDPRTGYSLTAAYGRLDARIKQHDSEVLFVDGVTDTYAGSEGNKAEVKAFVNSLLRLISPERGAVLLIGHVSKPTAMGIGGPTTEGYSGTTGWHNAARARWYLYPETEEGEEGGRHDRTGGLLMQLQKSNLGRIDQSLRFSWDDQAHMFLSSGVAAESLFDRNHRERAERRGILQSFRACAAQVPHIIVPTATQGKRTTYGVLVLRAEFPASLKQGKPSRARFWRGLEALKQEGLVAEQEYMRPDRHRAIQIVLTEKGQMECGVFN